ncbi:MAG: hypothetical protein IPN76_12845 [Saprospiraceae bacterium]|nr:hypothetical protein [Saprospiraceae bacterium]
MLFLKKRWARRFVAARWSANLPILAEAPTIFFANLPNPFEICWVCQKNAVPLPWENRLQDKI